MADQLRASSVRFLTAEDVVVGTGFLVSDRSLLSCAHVVSAALQLPENTPEIPKGKVHLDFPLVARGQFLTANVVLWQPPRPDGGGDLAMLQLDSDPPDGAQAVNLVMAEDLWEHSFRAFGFPEGRDEGVWASGKLRGRQATGWVQIEDVKDVGYRVQQGFSGGAVWDEQLDGIAGMVVAEETDSAIKAAYMIPTDVLVKTWPRLDQHTIPACPYRGLFAFQEQDAPFFFGRESFTEQLVEALRGKPLTAVIGSSGSGKSSVVFAGLLPRLRQEGDWLIASFRPGSRPFRSLAATLLALMEPQMSEIDRLSESNKLEERLQRGELALCDVVERLVQKFSGTHLLLIVDQFEELYTLCREVEVRQRFQEELLTAIRAAPCQSSLNLRVVITLRADFFGQALSYRPLADALQFADLKLGPMTAQELQDAIKKPAQKLSVRIEDGLTERILNEVSQEQSNLPLLEFALTLLWAKQRNRKLTHAAYNEIGGVEKALAEHAEQVYNELSQEEQQRTERIFVQLVRPGEGTEDTRRVAMRAEVGEDSWDVVVRLSNARLVVSGRDKATGEETVEIVHEALIRGWKRLRQWIEDNREFRTWQERLRAALRQWEASGKDEGALLRGAPLVEALRWIVQHSEFISAAEKEFIEISQQYQALEDQRWKDLYAKAEQQRQEAERQREEANRQRIEAERQREEANRSRQEAEQRREEANRQRQKAEQQSEEANRLRQEAEQQREEANRQRQKAEQEREEAERQRQEAERQRQVAQARQLMAQAELMRNQHGYLLQRSVLLAVEALQRSPSLEADQTLRASLALLPRPVARLLPKDDVRSVALSSDGHYLITASKGPTVEVWDVKSGRQFVRMNSGAEVKSLVFSLDGSRFATAGTDYTVRVWETISGRPIARLNNEGNVKTMTLNQNGRYLASTCGDGTVRIWDVPGGKQLARLTHEDINAINFSSDGRFLATAGLDCTARIWETTRGLPLARLAHARSVNTVVFSPDGHYLATGSADNTVRMWVWGANNKQPEATLSHEDSVTAVAFSPDGEYLATASKDHTARIWVTTSGRQITCLTHEGSVNSIAFSPSGRYLATTSIDRTVGVWEISSGYRFLCLPHKDVNYTESDYVHTVTFSPDGRHLTTASNNGAVGVWEVINGRLTHKRSVSAIAFNSNGSHLATASEDGTARVWEVTSGHPHVHLAHGGKVWAVAFSPNGRYIATGGEDGRVRIWEMAGGRQLLRLAHTGNVNALTFSPDGRYLATASGDSSVGVWEVTSGRQLVSLRHGGSVNAVAFSPNGKYLATASVDGTARLWQTFSGHQLTRLSHKSVVNTVVFSPDGNYIATASWDHTARIWEMTSDRQLFRLPHESKVWAVAFSSDSRYLATASKDQTARVWEVSSGRQLLCLAHEDSVDALSFSPNGKFLATASADRLAQVWEMTNGRQLALLTHEGGVNALAFSPDGKYLATASKDGTAQIWLWRSEDLIVEAQARLTRNLTQEEWRRYLGEEPYRKTCPNLPDSS